VLYRIRHTLLNLSAYDDRQVEITLVFQAYFESSWLCASKESTSRSISLRESSGVGVERYSDEDGGVVVSVTLPNYAASF
jgi:hypothetical protein